MLMIVLSLVVSTVAVILIYTSWRKRSNVLVATAGWLMAFLSVVPWSMALGTEIGVSYAFIVFICLVWLEVSFNMNRAAAEYASAMRSYQPLHWPAMKTSFRHGILFLLSVPAAGVITLMLSGAFVLLMPWSMPLRAAVAVFLYPVLWGALSAWVCTQNKLLKPFLVCAALLGASGLLLFV